MTTPPPRSGGRPTNGNYFADKQKHVEEHFESALRMVGDHDGADRVRQQKQGPTAGAPAQARSGGSGGKGTPGGDFMSNEDIRAFSEHVRKEARRRAVERSMDAAQLEARLRNIPDIAGSMAGARARARRVTRHLKLIAGCEKLIAKWASALYAAFEREYEAELMKIGKGRMQQKTRQPFSWR